jgi:hypothetical protein
MDEKPDRAASSADLKEILSESRAGGEPLLIIHRPIATFAISPTTTNPAKLASAIWSRVKMRSFLARKDLPQATDKTCARTWRT